MIPTIRPQVPTDNVSLSKQLNTFIQNLPWKAIFQRMPGTLVLFIIPFSIFGAVYAPFLFSFYFVSLHLFAAFQSIRTCYAVRTGLHQSVVHSTTNWLQKYCEDRGVLDGSDLRHDLPYDSIIHVIILPSYKEDLNTLCETLDILASHRRALTQYRVCLAMEEAEQGSDKKAEQLLSVYKDVFFEIRYTIHPTGRAGEIRGKSSNVAWASVQMARLSSRHENEILTVMDADTGIAEDFFNACAYHYCVAPPSERNIMMFCPSSVFDRNAKDVPLFVRVTDMFWSIGVLSNMYPGSPVKIPSSSYAVAMKLAVSVNFWDAGPEAIGEDMHMYLKCYFQTQGKVIVKSIYSPISSCNIEGEGTGVRGYMSGLNARYTQAKRHLWGSLDTGYVFRRSLLSILNASETTNYNMKHNQKKDEELTGFISLSSLVVLCHRMLESHVLGGQIFPMVLFTCLCVPSSYFADNAIQTYLWSCFSSAGVPPVVQLAVYIASWMRIICLIPTVLTWYYYEKYHQWVGFERWSLQETLHNVSSFGQEKQSSFPNPDMPVQYLGKRASLVSPRNRIHIFDWIFAGPSAFFFYVMPMFHAQLSHLYTDRLDYKVAGKPMVQRSVISEIVIQ